MKRRAILVLAIALVAVACTSDDEPAATTTSLATNTTTTTQPAAPSTTASTPTTSLPPVVIPALQPMSFGSLTPVPLLSGGTYAGPAAPSSLSGVYVPDWVETYLDNYDATGMLGDNGFVIVPSETRLFQHVYEGSFYEGWPVFLTTDAAYNVWHLAFDKILRETEQQTLLPALEDMVGSLVELARGSGGRTGGHRSRGSGRPGHPVLRSHRNGARPGRRPHRTAGPARSRPNHERRPDRPVPNDRWGRQLPFHHERDRLHVVPTTGPLHPQHRPRALLPRHVPARQQRLPAG